MRKTLRWIAWIVLTLTAIAFISLRVSPWPSALVYRYIFSRGGTAMNNALAKHVLPGVISTLDERYYAVDQDATFDIFHPAASGEVGGALPTIVWVHGGGFIGGTKDEVANYLRILASKGFTVIGVNYARAPAHTYPTPVLQVNKALDFFVRNAPRLRVDTAQLFLAGDSAGAQIAAQLANAISSPTYAAEVGVTPTVERRQLRGVILHCGFLDPEALDVNSYSLAGSFLRNVGWAYFGRKDFLNDPRTIQFSIVRSIAPNFPPIFISAGNADLLEPQSRRLAEAASRLGIPVDGLFFPGSYTPPLPHEYQFNLDTQAGQEALEWTLAFLRTNTK